MRGRRPKPTRLKLLSGARIRARPGREPVATGAPEMPTWLDPVAAAEWRRIAPILTSMGLVGAVDRAALAAYCDTYSTWARAERALTAAGGLTITNARGAVRPHPLLAIARAAADQMRKFMVELGMTPSSRSRLSGASAAGAGANPFEELARDLTKLQ